MTVTCGEVGAGRGEPRFEQVRVRQASATEDRAQLGRQFSFAATLVRQSEQTDHDPTGVARRYGANQCVPSLAELGAREELIAVDQIKQCVRLAAQRVDDVAIIHHVDGANAHGTALRCASARQVQHRLAAEEALDPLIIYRTRS